MPLRQYKPTDVGGSGRALVAKPGGWSQHAKVLGDRLSYNWEGASGAAAAVFELQEPVRTIVVWSAVDVYLATSAAALGAPAAGTPDGRFLVKAGERRELPWYQNEVHHQAPGGGGALTVEGRV